MMAVHRITDAAEVALQEIARREGKKPSAVLSDLVVDYLKGLEFDTETHIDLRGGFAAQVKRGQD